MLRFSHFFHLTGQQKRNPQYSFHKCSKASILKKLNWKEPNQIEWELGQLTEWRRVVMKHTYRSVHFIITSFKPISFKRHSFANFYRSHRVDKLWWLFLNVTRKSFHFWAHTFGATGVFRNNKTLGKWSFCLFCS